MLTRQALFSQLWFWSLAMIASLFLLPFAANTAMQFVQTSQAGGTIAPLFTRSVQHWERDISRWSSAYEIDPNLMATIMQIESCGHPSVISHAGARGLFQVMPFHFDSGENMVDPYTNAFRSANFIRECTGYASGDVGLTLACYNGGPSVTWRSIETWPHETQRYYHWGLGIYQDATSYASRSNTLDEWLQAGGVSLCNSASVALGITYPLP